MAGDIVHNKPAKYEYYGLHFENDDIKDHSEARIDQVFALLLDELPAHKQTLFVIQLAAIARHSKVFGPQEIENPDSFLD